MIANCPSISRWHAGVPGDTRWPTSVGYAVLAAWLIGFGGWAALAPIDGAIVSSGTFVATGQNKLVQHLEGGIVREILVKEGDLVDANQPVIRLDDTAPKARLRRLVSRQHRLLAMQARLQSELQERSSLTFPPALTEKRDDPDVQEILAGQRLEFDVRQNRVRGEIEILRREIQSLEETMGGIDAQISAAETQVRLFRDELKDKATLLSQALVRRSDVFATQRAEARSVGELGQLKARAGDTRERIARASQQIAQVRSIASQKASEELRAVETELDDIREQTRAARDVVDRVDVLAPVKGVVVKLNFHTLGGVVSPGATLIEMLPVNDELIIESRVTPTDVAHVQSGQMGQVRLSALNQRITPFISARVVYVSADAVNETDPRKAAAPGSHGTFVVRVALDQSDLRRKVADFVPTPGMPAEVFIKTGERTFFQYLVKPIMDSFQRAFREV